MLFLKQLRAHGFKSFADPLVLDFTHNIIGIVGPNGSGKSNITDAIRWALGEQSTKSLRGASLDDIVFSGTSNHDSVNVAQVTLVFDNSQRAFKSLSDDFVEITRKFNKKTRESSFFLNQKPVRLREIQELALETGLTRSSIAIISQGMVTQFAEAKPENRRDIFDEAIGMAKYKKRKREAQQKLGQARENHGRLQDLTNEIGSRLPNLKKQAAKAQMYQDKIQALKEYELAILKLDVHNFQAQLSYINQDLVAKNIQANQLAQDLENSQLELNQIIENSQETELALNRFNQQFQDVLNDLSQTRSQQTEFEAREKNALQERELDDFKVKDLKRRYQSLILEKQSKNQKLLDIEKALAEAKSHFDYLNQQYNQKNVQSKELARGLYQANFNYQQLKANQGQVNSAYNNPALKAIVANKAHLNGIIGPLLELIEVESRYQIALSAGAGSTLLSVVAQDALATKRGIEFLKQNKSGRVTFLPLNNLVPSRISGSIRDFIVQQPGFIGFGNDLAKVKSDYNVALDYALASLIVAQDYDSALELSKATDKRFSIVTLTGEKFLPRGAVVGGAYRNQNLFSHLESDTQWEKIQLQKIKDLEQKDKIQNQELNALQQQKDRARDDLNNMQNQVEQLQHQLNQFEKDLKFINEEHQLLTGSDLNPQVEDLIKQSPLIKLNHKISRLITQRDEIQSEINRLNLVKTKNLSEQDRLNKFNQKTQQLLLPLQKEIGKLAGEKSFLESKLNDCSGFLVKKYQLTLENVLASPKPSLPNEAEARLLIENLTADLSRLGNVNLEALTEYPEEQKRFDYYQEQLQDIITSINQMENIIQEIDQEMQQQFQKIISDVNRVLPQAFKKMFGGGQAELFFDQPDNLLETGIDIKLNPPGKKITNLNLLSGGEKSLVALSVLFSLLQVHPLPLVILDEAEAPLDPSNVERFASYVKEFTKITQFIVITHREGTMANCDILFGVTMQVPGITKMVKIQLSES